MVRLTDHPAMTIAVDLGHKATKQTNKQTKDEIPPYVAFHLGLHCLPKYLFNGIQNEKSLYTTRLCKCE